MPTLNLDAVEASAKSLDLDALESAPAAIDAPDKGMGVPPGLLAQAGGHALAGAQGAVDLANIAGGAIRHPVTAAEALWHGDRLPRAIPALPDPGDVLQALHIPEPTTASDRIAARTIENLGGGMALGGVPGVIAALAGPIAGEIHEKAFPGHPYLRLGTELIASAAAGGGVRASGKPITIKIGDTVIPPEAEVPPSSADPATPLRRADEILEQINRDADSLNADYIAGGRGTVNAMKNAVAKVGAEEFRRRVMENARTTGWGRLTTRERAAVTELTATEINAETDLVALAAPQEPASAVSGPVGRTGRAYGPQNEPYEYRYRLVSLDDLGVNDPAVQPRDRSRVASRVQIDKIAKHPDAERYLAGDTELDKGPVIIGPDKLVESGNGRVSGFRLSREQYPEKYATFQGRQRELASQVGFTPEQFDAVPHALIVRERVTQVGDRLAFAEAANRPSVLAHAPAEQAAADARRMPPEAVTSLRVGESQTLDQALQSPTNAGAVRSFLSGLDPNELASLVTADGQGLTPLGLQRLKAALAAHTFPGPAGQRLVRSLTESADSGVRNVEAGIFSNLGPLAKLRQLVSEGARAPLDITEDIPQAVEVLARLRAQGMDVEKYLRQGTLGARELTGFQEQLLQAFGDAKSTKQVRELLDRYVHVADAAPPPGQGGLPGLTLPAVTKESVLRQALAGPQASFDAVLGGGTPQHVHAQWRGKGGNRPPDEPRLPTVHQGLLDVGGPVSPTDGLPAFDPNVPPWQPPELTSWERIRDVWRKRITEQLPQEARIVRNVPDSPVISQTEGFQRDLTDGMSRVITEADAQRAVPVEDWINAEARAVARLDAGATPEEAATEFPEPLQNLMARRTAALAEEQQARELLGLPEFREAPFPYLARRARDIGKETVRVFRRGTGYGTDLQTTIGSFAKERTYRTMREGLEAGVQYEDPRVSALMREWTGLRLRATAKYIESLKGTTLFETMDEARAAAAPLKTTPTVVEDFVPGGRRWYARSREEAVFIKHQFQSKESSLGQFVRWSNFWFRNPNLFNPLPHFSKNMMGKFVLAGGRPTRLVRDAVEFFRATNPELKARFEAVMPFEKSGASAHELLDTEIGRIDPEAAPSWIRKLKRAVQRPNAISSKAIFQWGDPSMRYSLWKNYVRKGMGDQEAANHAWVDLIRYSTRSEIVDAWKSVPMNFFVPWRYGTIVSLLKQVRNHPVRTALLVGAIDYARELRYRESGRWTHLPWDYALGPVAQMMEEPSSALRIIPTAMLFGPGAAFVVTGLRDLFSSINDPSGWARLRGMFWGISQFYELPEEWHAYERDHHPEHLVNMIMSAMAGEHATKGYEPSRLSKALPDALPGLHYDPAVTRDIWLHRKRQRKAG